MKYLLIFILGLVGGVGGMWGWEKYNQPKTIEIKKEYPLLKYTIENLGMRQYDSQIILDDETSPGVFKFHFDSDGKNVTGLAHMPDGCIKCPVIAQFRGYQDVDTYKPGNGTRRSAQEFAKAGFISLALDFLGYGGSASPSADVFEARFETYTTALNLLAAIEKWDKTDRIGVWGHSNGGQIALTVAEIKNYPTVLWAPVSAPFPYSILYYTHDNGKLLRRKLAKFEEDYDTDLFSPLNYIGKIVAPVLVQQGSGDEQVPVKWNDALYKKIQDSGSNIQYVVYPGADHNLMPSWSEAVKADIEFYKKHW